MRKPSDIHSEWLVLRSQDGDHQALAELVDVWHAVLLRHAIRLTGTREAGLEVMQEAWVAIVSGLARLDDPTRFRGWAYRIVGNKSADWIRRRQRLPRQSADWEVAPSATVSNNDGDLEQVRTAMAKLPSQRRQLLALAYADGLTIREIAVAMGIPQGTVKSRLHHARQELRELIEGEES